ncbi:Methionine synthase, vitamin-B12 independent [Bosea sp. LC85]|uniref:5-methyltetrahydropteroyltriglutamate-- homocysteine S-methyltransferase n=1 Tax=Bosea sp. LC85 TaxID=1502851 RepID=UPI0004E42FF5|nr:5-methyltetrahydropteroyltriglutamate--homocysteine S-methyltransferase [Bosea sp. LC85]KFC71632.1 Methionine synthase, vitamin-B12 independent [Bosea sp. LC85]
MPLRHKPPFRADMVGSLLRSARVKDARARLVTGEISAAELTAIEDAEIRALVKKQEEVGLQAVTDGEFRRAFWHFDFLENLSGVQGYDSDSGIQFKGVATKARGLRVTGKLDFPDDHPHLAHFRFLASVTDRVPKMTIPSPSMLHYRGGRKAVDISAYFKMEDYYADLGKAYAKAVRAFYDAGCRYLQLDDTSLSYFCDPEQRQMLVDRGDDPDKLIHIYRDVINTATAAKPADMTITTHTCRGNFKSTFIASGGYEPVADLVFNQINVDGYFMEWDDDRSGGFEPLRFLPKGKQVVLGLVTSKFGSVESKDNLKRRIEQASVFAPLDQLCLSPQCGFASTEEGNVLAEDEQWAKLARIVEVAREVWG